MKVSFSVIGHQIISNNKKGGINNGRFAIKPKQKMKNSMKGKIESISKKKHSVVNWDT